VLTKPSAASQSTQDWRLAAVDLFKQGRVQDARKVICSQASSEDMDSVYRWMYDNLGLWSSEAEKQDLAIVVIRNALVNVPMVADQEINLSACLIELCQLK
jgi:hypothetical protein